VLAVPREAGAYFAWRACAALLAFRDGIPVGVLSMYGRGTGDNPAAPGGVDGV